MTDSVKKKKNAKTLYSNIEQTNNVKLEEVGNPLS